MVWGLILYPEGNILHKFLWAIIFCGLGMGATAGSAIIFMISCRQKGYPAIVYCMLISFVLLGLLCNVLCFRLDLHFGFFGGAGTPKLFIWNGTALGGWLVGWLSFTIKCKRLATKIGL